MTAFTVDGGRRTDGTIRVQGAKNSVLPILAATLLIHNKSVIHNCPPLGDVDAALKILVKLGCVCVNDHQSVIVDATDVANYEIPKTLMHEMRSSVLFLGAIISRMGRAVITSPGGCELGPRPIDLHLSSLKQCGVNVREEEGTLFCSAPNGLHGATIKLPFPSVGATENIMIAVAVSKGTTVIYGAAKEPEISDLADFLNAAGAKISGAGSDTVIIEGVKSLHSTEHKVIPDRIVAATYLSAAAITGGRVCLKEARPEYYLSVLKVFEQMGCTLTGKGQELTLCAREPLRGVSTLVTRAYPGFPTDAGPLLVPVLCRAEGESRITETIFENRFRFVEQLRYFGADININGRTATVIGRPLLAATVDCTDLRGGTALVLAALAASGRSFIREVHHIKRGYYDLPGCLSALGCEVKEVEIDGSHTAEKEEITP